MTRSKFRITQFHLDLLNNMYVNFDDSCYEGAPCIDMKRPYGNSMVIGDLFEIFILERSYNFPFKHRIDFNEDNNELFLDIFGMSYYDISEFLLRAHTSTHIVLQICLHTQQFKTGLYECDNCYRWRYICE